jgi:hypothetical protein
MFFLSLHLATDIQLPVLNGITIASRAVFLLFTGTLFHSYFAILMWLFVLQATPSSEECPSLEHIQASELYPKRPLVSDDDQLSVPFPVLHGESVEYLGRTADGAIALSNYRVFIR